MSLKVQSAKADKKVISATIEATVIRADGRREPLGQIAYYHRNPLKRWAWAVGKWWKERKVA